MKLCGGIGLMGVFIGAWRSLTEKRTAPHSAAQVGMHEAEPFGATRQAKRRKPLRNKQPPSIVAPLTLDGELTASQAPGIPHSVVWAFYPATSR